MTNAQRGTQKPLYGQPPCATCGRPSRGLDAFREFTGKRRATVRKASCGAAGCRRGSFVKYPWVYDDDADGEGGHAV